MVSDEEKELEMHPVVMFEVARHRQADMLREAERARLAHQISLASDPKPRRRFRLPRIALSGHGKPALGGR